MRSMNKPLTDETDAALADRLREKHRELCELMTELRSEPRGYHVNVILQCRGDGVVTGRVDITKTVEL